MNLFAELRRRNVIRVGLAYLVLAWLLVQVASILLPAFDAPAWVLRVLVLVLAAGFVATLVFSWVFELTPEGLKREHEVARDESITHLTAKKLDLAVIVGLVAAVGVTLWTHHRAGAPTTVPAASPAVTSAATTAPADDGPSLAVLPFVNMSAVAENEYFSDGLTETLLNMLAQVEGLKVTARTSAFAFKGQNKDVREIAATLDVRAVLEGSVQRAGDRVRITAQLIDAADGKHLWSQSYDRKLDDLFAIQDEIASAVAKELTRQLLGDGATPKVGAVGTNDAEAYDLYLRGLESLNRFSVASLTEAERHFKQALARDANFDTARRALVRTYHLMADTGHLQWPEATARSERLLAPLIERAEPDPEAIAYKAFFEWEGPEDLDVDRRARVLATIAHALAQAPNSVSIHLLATEVTPRGQGEQALEIIDHGLVVDPMSFDLLGRRAYWLRVLKRYDEALAACARLRELNPDSGWGHQIEMYVHGDRGESADDILWATKSMALDPDDHEIPAHVAQVLLTMGLATEALPWIKHAELLGATGSDTRRVTIQYAEQSGDRDRALALAREVLRERRDNRRWVYGMAAIYYLTLMDEAGKLDEALAFIDEVSPGVAALPPPAPATPLDSALQAVAAGFVAKRETPAQRRQRGAYVRELLQRNPDLDLDTVPWLYALEGDTRRAVSAIVRILGEPRELPNEWRVSVLRDPLLAGLMREPEAAAALEALESRLAAQAARYRELVAAGEIKVP